MFILGKVMRKRLKNIKKSLSSFRFISMSHESPDILRKENDDEFNRAKHKRVFAAGSKESKRKGKHRTNLNVFRKI